MWLSDKKFGGPVLNDMIADKASDVVQSLVINGKTISLKQHSQKTFGSARSNATRLQAQNWEKCRICNERLRNDKKSTDDVLYSSFDKALRKQPEHRNYKRVTLKSALSRRSKRMSAWPVRNRRHGRNRIDFSPQTPIRMPGKSNSDCLNWLVAVESERVTTDQSLIWKYT